jgi:dTDP-glucose pyrophosphorylase
MTKPEAQQPDAPKSNFEVVDTYSYDNRICSVIRYTTPSTTWEYFLDCKEVKK